MNVVLPKEYKVSKKDIVIYTISIIVCVVALTVMVTMQVIGEGVLSKNKIQIATEEEKIRLKSEFENMFTNKFEGKVENIKKQDNEKEIVYSSYENTESASGDFTLNVHLPAINIKEKEIENINNEIARKYKQQVNQILNSKGSQSIYSVEYVARIENNIMFLIIRSNLKQGTNAQKLMIDTYSYDLESQKQITLEEMIEKLNYSKDDVQNEINKEIKREEQNSKSLKELGYSIFVRDSSHKMYKVENSKQFFMNNGKLHIVYAYGNDVTTSELDLIVI